MRHTCPLIESEVIRKRHDCFPLDSYAVGKCALCTAKYPISRFKGTLLWDLGTAGNLPREFCTECEREGWFHLIFTLRL